MSEQLPRAHRAGLVALLAIALGLLGQALFFEAPLGLNVPLATLALLAAGWALRPSRRRPSLPDLLLPVAALIFAIPAALRDDSTLVALDVFASLGFSGAALAAFAGTEVLRRPALAIVSLALRCAGSVAAGAVAILTSVRPALPPAASLRHPSGRAAPILRGVVIAIPVLIVFAALFAGADAVFARAVEDLLRFDVELGDLPARTLFAAFIAWLAAGALAFVTRGPHEVSEPAVAWRLGTGEAVTVLVLVDLLFAAFVLLQATYLFGGQDTLAASGLTYSEYARRGFFELIVVAALAGCGVLLLENIVARRSPAYVAATVALLALIGVVLASSLLRLRLYQEAYGWTELRFYTIAGIAWLGLAVLLAIATVLTGRARWLPHALVAAAVVVAIGVNVIGPVAFITDQNLARRDAAIGVDLAYLGSLESDAVPAIVAALDGLDARDRKQAEEMLGWHRDHLAVDAARGWAGWNLSRERARSLLSR
jgi:hypothetical protein